MPKTSHRPHVAIVGAGFSGFQAAQSLAASGEFEITLLDRDGRHVFTPLIYQVATGILRPDDITVSPRSHLPRGARVLAETVRRVNFDRHCLETDSEAIPYDYLVLATGSKSRIIDIPGARDHALPFMTLEDAIVVRQRFAELLTDETLGRVPSVAIVGGGTTGCELAGSLAEWAKLLDRELRIHLLQSGDRLLSEFDAKPARAAQRRLQRLGVEVLLETRVQRVMQHAVLVDRGRPIAADIVVWTAGVAAAVPQVSAKSVIGETGKLRVRPTLQLNSNWSNSTESARNGRPSDSRFENVFAIGDVAIDGARPRPAVAPVALQQGVAVARNIYRHARGQPLKPFRYLDKGRLAIVGGYLGVGRIAGVPFSGPLAWFLWLAVHWVYLPGWGNRRAALLAWWRTYGLGARSRRPLPRSQSISSSITPQP